VEYGRRLTRIEPAETGHRLIFADGSAVKADATIVTVPVTALRGIVFDVPLPDRLAEFAQEVSLGHNEKVFAGFDGHPWRRPGGFGSDVWTDGPAAVAWDNSVRQPDLTDGALTLFTGGRHAESLGESGAFARAVLSALDPAFLGLLSGMNGRTARTNWGATRGLHGAYTSFAPGQLTRFGSCFWIEEDGEAVQEVRAGNLAFAGEHLSDAFYGYMNGGAETGRLAAHSVTRALAR
jgi:monoamine oxidase